MRTFLLACLIFCLVAMPAWTAPASGTSSSVALAEDAMATVWNPAGLGWNPGPGLHLALSGPANGLLGFSLGAGGMAVSLEGGRQEITFASAIPLATGWRGGLSYRLGNFQGKTGGDYDVGLLWRTYNWLSLAAVARNLGGTLPGEDKNYQMGLAWRPIGERLTLSIDGRWTDKLGIRQIVPELGLELEPANGIFLRLAGTSESINQFNPALTIGLAVSSPRWDVGGWLKATQLQNQLPPVPAGYLRFREARGAASLLGGREIMEIELAGNLGSGAPAFGFLAGGDQKPAIAPTLYALEQAVRDPRVIGLALKIGDVSASLADIQEVRNAIKEVRGAGKVVIAYLSTGSFSEIYLASAANRILLNQLGVIDFTSFADETLFYRGLLDKVGLKAEFVSTGPYKTAMESFTRHKHSPEGRQQLDDLVDDQFRQVIAGIAEGRERTVAEIREQVNRGYLSAPEALQVGLVDELAPEDALTENLMRLTKTEAVFDGFKRLDRIRSWSPPRIAIVHAMGAINEGFSGDDLLMGRTLGERTLIEALSAAREDQRIKAVVLRLDTPGGSAVAAEAVRREVERLRETKPVIVSMGGVAASGGYWIACGTDRLLASPGSVTGSIGVVVGKFSAGELLDKLAIRSEMVGRGKYANMHSLTRPFSADELALLQSSADFTYGRFLELVSDARHLPPSQTKELAGGHIYSGERALSLGLIDREGGLLTALAEAKMAAGIRNEEVEVVYLPGQQPWRLASDPLVLLDTTAALRKTLGGLARWGRTDTWLLDPRFFLY
ncbi:MAG: signal peptide peptidase SppA [Cyanobacteria bacterium NC_groundwater_1444_Ag_S-0.65um_54_12]|nr:signal peptide peptidase SppA [Cyanobacteria bacterium NC_groundwater_1444_Ag_S-0.65um_54_12]